MRKLSAQQTTICVFFELAFAKFCSCSASSPEKLKNTKTTTKKSPAASKKQQSLPIKDYDNEKNSKIFQGQFSLLMNFLLLIFCNPLNSCFDFEVFIRKIAFELLWQKICVGPLSQPSVRFCFSNSLSQSLSCSYIERSSFATCCAFFRICCSRSSAHFSFEFAPSYGYVGKFSLHFICVFVGVDGRTGVKIE